MQRIIAQLLKKGGQQAPSQNLMSLLVGGIVVGTTIYDNFYTVPAGHRAVMFNRKDGVVHEPAIPEGTHWKMPWYEYPTIYSLVTKKSSFKSATATADLQMVNVAVRIMYKPAESMLDVVHETLGERYDELVLPSIVNETLKGVIAKYNANQLVTQRTAVTADVQAVLRERAAQFNIIVQDVSVTHTNFSDEYNRAIDDKKIAQQNAERAKFRVRQASEEAKSVILRAEGAATAAATIGKAMSADPSYIELTRLRAAVEIAEIVASSHNKMYLDSESLLLNVTHPAADVLDINRK